MTLPVRLADIYEGRIVDSTLVLDNLESGTFWGSRNGKKAFAFRLEFDLRAVDAERRAWVFISEDGGGSWKLFQTTRYRGSP